MKKKNSILIVTMFLILFITGCQNNNLKKTCSKSYTMSDNKTEIAENYEIYYDKNTKVVTKTISNGVITSSDTDVLKLHLDSNEKICKIYNKIDYYDCQVNLSGSSLFVKKIIDYEKVDYKKIIEIEGSTGNIFENNGDVKLDKIISVYESSGLECN